MIDRKLKTFVDVNLAAPTDLSAEGVYNFFTPDERESEDSGLKFSGASSFSDPDSPVGQNKVFFKDNRGRLIPENNLKGQTPRFIQLNFLKPQSVPETTERNYNLREKQEEGHFYLSEEIQSPQDLSFRISDLSVVRRLTRKLDLASQLESHGELSVFTTEGINQASLDPQASEGTVSQKGNENQNIRHEIRQIVDSIVNLNMASNVEDVNEISSEVVTDPRVSKAQTMSIFGTLNRQDLDMIFSSPVDKQRLMSEVVKSFYTEDSVVEELSGQSLGDLRVDLNSHTLPLPDDQIERSTVKLAGYMIERYETGETIVGNEPERIFFISTPEASSFIDPLVKYGVEYTYTVRSVYEVVFIEENPDGRNRLTAWITSEPTDPVAARVVEFKPPNEPDGVMYSFNFSERRGLQICWQYPVGTQRDTKYFQIFRRKSIKEPFTCIGMIDFDNSFLKTPPREFVRPDKVVKYNRSYTFFEDKDFYKESSFIYAVASVDAHGYTSGYSAQARISFVKSENRLVVKRVSPPGAPKQYPNFFVDPDEDENVFVNTLTQDCIKSSGLDRLIVYFDPDGKKYREGEGVFVAAGDEDNTAKNIFYTNTPDENQGVQDQGKYKIVMINLDRQKSKTVELVIQDIRGTGFFPAE